MLPEAFDDMFEVVCRLDLPPVPIILLGVLRGGWMIAGFCRFLAGLYVGLGALGKGTADNGVKGSLGG